MFENFISLGSACAIAGNLSRYGLRSFSGPFDWLITNNFKAVIGQLETRFADFVVPENLIPQNYHSCYYDEKKDIYFTHEYILDEQDMVEFQKKMDRLAARFLMEIQKKTCFVRWIRNVSDLEYIIEEKENIFRILKSYNPENEIIYIVEKSLDVTKLQEKGIDFFIHEVPPANMTGEDVRNFFSTNNEIEAYFWRDDIYPAERRKDNLIFYLRKNLEYQKGWKDKFDLLTKIEQVNYESLKLPSQIAIYGFWGASKILYEKIKSFTEVTCFFDRWQTPKSGWDNLPVYGLLGVEKPEDDVTIVITVIGEFENIKHDLVDKLKWKNPIISLNELLGIS